LRAEQNKGAFFTQIISLLQPLKSYIKRRLRMTYLEQQILTPRQTTGDILDQVTQVLREIGDPRTETIA
jgi:hypothetical protein